MSCRLMTPYNEHPSRDYLESLPSVCHDDTVSPGHEQMSRKRRKRRSRTQSVTEDVDKSDVSFERHISVSSDVSIDDDLAGSNPVATNPDSIFTTNLVSVSVTDIIFYLQ